MTRDMFSLFIAVFLIVGFSFLALPEKGFAGLAVPSTGCCITPIGDCTNFDGDAVACLAETVLESGTCTFEGPGGICANLEPISTPIPTMSEWGLLAFAGIAGIASLIVIRRRAKTA